jgi:hypothetical protein
MQDTQMSTEAFRFYRWAAAVAERSDLTPTTKLVAHALAQCANAKTGLCCPSQKTLAAAIGTKRAATVSEAIAGLVRAGLLLVEHGGGNRASYVLLSAGAEVRKYASADVSDTPERTSEVRQSGHPTRNYEENYEGKVAPALTRPTDPAGDRANEIALHYVSLRAAHVKLAAPTQVILSKRDRDAATVLADRLDEHDWRDQMDLAMRYGLKGSDWMRRRVTTLAGLAEHIDELLGRDDRAETGPPPAAWDDPDDQRDYDVHGALAEMPRVDGLSEVDAYERLMTWLTAHERRAPKWASLVLCGAAEQRLQEAALSEPRSVELLEPSPVAVEGGRVEPGGEVESLAATEDTAVLAERDVHAVAATGAKRSIGVGVHAPERTAVPGRDLAAAGMLVTSNDDIEF